MPRHILKLPNGRYLMWSTVPDAPVTYGMQREEFYEWYLAEYGASGMDGLDDRMARADETGSSERGASINDTILFNRAGEGETELNLDQIVESFGEPPKAFEKAGL